MSFIVEGVNWELAGTLYSVVWPIALPIYTWFSVVKRVIWGEEIHILPPKIGHAAIIVYGYVYEYCNEGVKKTTATALGDPGSVCSVHKFLVRASSGSTCVSLERFDTWVAEMMAGRFSKEKYCVAENNCFHFAMEAARFLNVGTLVGWRPMINFTENNPTICKLANGSTNSSS